MTRRPQRAHRSWSRWVLAVLFAAPSASFACLGEVPGTPPESPYRITGVVLSERDGSPVSTCHLTATLGRGGSAAARTQRQRAPTDEDGPSAEADATGHFSLLLPSAGNWQVYGYARGFRRQAYEHHEEFFSAVVLTPAAPTYEMNLRLEPDSAVTGFVLDEAGEGVRNARLTLSAAEPSSPDLIAGPGLVRSSTTTDDRGHYEFAGLAPGEYTVSVLAEPWYAAASQGRRFSPTPASPSDPSLDVVYPQVWFPGVADRRSAEVLSLHHGESRQANFNLTPIPATHLHLSAPPPLVPGAQRGQIFPTVERVSPDGPPRNTAIQIDSQGQIDVGGLSPGLYRVSVPRPDDQESPTFIRVPSGAQHSLDLSAAIPAADLTLHFDVAGGAERVQVILTDIETGARFFSYQPGSLQRRHNTEAASPAPGADRKLVVPPARYRVSLSDDGEVYLSGMSVKNTSINGRDIALPSGATTLTLRLTRGRASVSGIASLAGKPLTGAMVMLVPATFGQAGSIAILRRDQTNTDGGFLIENVIPGDYILLAIDRGWSVNWRDPSTLQGYLLHGIPVALHSNASVKQDLAAQSP